MNKQVDKQFKARLVNSMINSKIRYGVELWGAEAPKTVKTIQRIQDKAADLALGQNFHLLSNKQKRTKLNWLSVDEMTRYNTLNITHKILNHQSPVEFSQLMPLNNSITRRTEDLKLATKPKELNSRTRKTTLRSRAYHYNTIPSIITKIKDNKKFKLHLKQYILNPDRTKIILQRIKDKMNKRFTNLNLLRK